jgi:hypothetical protein
MQTALTNYFTNLDAVHAKYENQEEPDGQEMIGDLKKTRDGYYKELKGFLSEDQYNGYMELKEKVLHEIFSEIAGLRLYDFKEPLKLTDDQMTKMKPILGDAIRGFFGVIFEYGDKRMSVRNKLKIANALKGIQSDTNEKIKPILTPEQWETWQKMKEAAKEEG